MNFFLSNVWANVRWYAAFSKLKSNGTPEEARAAQRAIDALMQARVDDSGGVIQVGSVQPGEPAHVMLTPHGMVVNEAEGATMHGLDGSTLLVRPDGSQEMSNPAVDRVDVHDLRVISDIRIDTIYQTTSHHFSFFGGGTLSFVIDATGKIIEIHTKNVGYSTDKRTRVMTVYGTPVQNARST